MPLFRATPWLLLAALLAPSAFANDIQDSLEAIRAVDREGAGHVKAKQAWKDLSKASAADLPKILAGMDGAGPLATNWLRAVVDAIAERTIDEGEPLPTAELEAFIGATEHSPRARRLAFEWLTKIDETAEARLIPGMLNDPSLELRRDAVAVQLEKANKLADGGDAKQAEQAYVAALNAARDLDQIKVAKDALEKLGVEVDLARQFGFLTEWKLIGPFDNQGGNGFGVVYPPEKKIDPQGAYDGMEGKVRWKSHATDDEYGVVDLNETLGRVKGAIVYAVADFESDAAQDVDFRLGCINANKLWVNGQLLMSNEVYHAGMEIDQYVVRGRLNKGKNTILLKVAQNEQTEPWAQRWQFQLRVCDDLGTAILSADRK